jgi:hypothetical protein
MRPHLLVTAHLMVFLLASLGDTNTDTNTMVTDTAIRKASPERDQSSFPTAAGSISSSDRTAVASGAWLIALAASKRHSRSGLIAGGTDPSLQRGLDREADNGNTFRAVAEIAELG